jgi:hypothetical protein
MEALGNRRDGDRVAVAREIVQWVDRADPDLRASASLGLRSLGPVAPDVVTALIAALARAEGESAVHAALVLESYPPAAREAAVPALAELLADRTLGPRTRLLGLRILGRHADTHEELIVRAATTALWERNPKDGLGLSHILDSLKPLGPRAKPLLPLIFASMRRQSDVHGHGSHGWQALAHIEPGGEKSIPELIDLLNGKNMTSRVLAIEALAAFGSVARGAIPSLELLAKHKNWSINYQARLALDAIG